jgi:hypothetical protein
MLTWTELVHLRPDITEPGLRLLYPAYAGVGLAYLSTVRSDGGPRVHPMCPIVNDRGLFALIVPGPKRDDLLRDGRYAMHSFPTEDNEDGFYLTGRASRVSDESRHAAIVHQFVAERQSLEVEESDVSGQIPFTFDIDTAMLTRTTGHGDPRPEHLIWRLRAGA